jgi:hypothetical protein
MFTFFLLLTQQVGATLLENSGDFIYQYGNGTTLQYSLFKDGYGPGGVLKGFSDFVQNADTFILSAFLANLAATAFIAQLLYGNKHQEQEEEDDSDLYTDTDTEADDKEEPVYESQYFKQLEDMPDLPLSQDELTRIGHHVLIEETPKGIVHMGYNITTETFDYYTDHFVDVTYEMLDTVARLFAITFHCKQVCVNYREEVRKGEQNMLSEIEFDKLKKEIEERKVKNSSNKERSVFASFKNYNKNVGSSGNVSKKYYIVTEKANRFKYKGKISDYEKAQKKTAEEATVNCVRISYSDYKRHLTESTAL